MGGSSRTVFIAWIGGGFIAWWAAVLLTPLIGAHPVDVGEAFSALTGNSPAGLSYDILLLQRLPRALLGGLAGGT